MKSGLLVIFEIAGFWLSSRKMTLADGLLVTVIALPRPVACVPDRSSATSALPALHVDLLGRSLDVLDDDPRVGGLVGAVVVLVGREHDLRRQIERAENVGTGTRRVRVQVLLGRVFRRWSFRRAL